MSEQIPTDEHLFAVGEIAIFWVPGDEDHGKQCVIASPLEFTRIRGADGVIRKRWNYTVEMQQESFDPLWPLVAAEPHELRKLPGNREDHAIVRWADVPWQPEQVQA